MRDRFEETVQCVDGNIFATYALHLLYLQSLDGILRGHQQADLNNLDFCAPQLLIGTHLPCRATQICSSFNTWTNRRLGEQLEFTICTARTLVPMRMGRMR